MSTQTRREVRQIADRNLGIEDTSATNLVFEFDDTSDAKRAAQAIRKIPGVTATIKNNTVFVK